MKIPEKILSIIKKEKKILISAHINLDGDAIGSALALSAALESIGKKTFVHSKDAVPKFYRFLPGHNKFRSDIENILKNDAMLILLDCNSLERAAIDRYRFRSSIVIDHHETDFGELSRTEPVRMQYTDRKDLGGIDTYSASVEWIDRNAAATGIMVFHLIKALGVKITKDIAANLYTAISADTGTFRFNNTYAEVLRVGAELIESGAEPNLIADCLYETWDRKRFNLLMMALNTLEIKNGIAMMHITKEMFKKTGTKPEDTENFSNFPRMINSVKISAMFREISPAARGDDSSGSSMWKVSLRSKGDVNVAKIAELYGGGGHKNAAGFRIEADLRSAKEVLLKASRKLRRQEDKKLRN